CTVDPPVARAELELGQLRIALDRIDGGEQGGGIDAIANRGISHRRVAHLRAPHVRWCVRPAHSDRRAWLTPGKTRTSFSQDTATQDAATAPPAEVRARTGARYRVEMRTLVSSACSALVLLLALFPAAAAADGSWLDQPLNNWNQAGMDIPQAPPMDPS